MIFGGVNICIKWFLYDSHIKGRCKKKQQQHGLVTSPKKESHFRSRAIITFWSKIIKMYFFGTTCTDKLRNILNSDLTLTLPYLYFTCICPWKISLKKKLKMNTWIQTLSYRHSDRYHFVHEWKDVLLVLKVRHEHTHTHEEHCRIRQEPGQI